MKILGHQRLYSLLAALGFSLGLHPLAAQSVSPLISEYTDHAEGSFEVTNGSAAPAVVVLEPRSFDVNPDGNASFRALDGGIHLELSTRSMRLEPHQSAHVFYKVSADRAPAWLCIYAAFSPAVHQPGLAVRVMLPHTIYVYQHRPLPKESMSVGRVWFDADDHTVRAELSNESDMAGRAQDVEVTGPHGYATGGGFPMLPHSSRLLTLAWTDGQPPKEIVVHFPEFALKLPISPSHE